MDINLFTHSSIHPFIDIYLAMIGHIYGKKKKALYLKKIPWPNPEYVPSVI